MSLCPRRGLLALLPLLCLALPAPARAEGGIEDSAGLFSRDARSKADLAIDDISRRTGKDLVIETMNRLSPEKIHEYRGLKTDAERAVFFRSLAEQQARRRAVNGVYVFLCRVPAVEEPHPGFFRFIRDKFNELLPPQVVGHAVVVRPDETEKFFPPDDQAQLNALFGKIKVAEHNQDKVLAEAVKFAGDQLELHARQIGAPPPDTFRWTSVLWAAVALTGAWMGLGLLRARVAARQGTPGPVPGARQPLAALFGTASVLWLIEAYLARRSETPPAPEPPAPEPAPVAEADGIPPDGPMHPDDLEAIARAPRPWEPEDAEAARGHDHS
jgi:hypothetical protein